MAQLKTYTTTQSPTVGFATPGKMSNYTGAGFSQAAQLQSQAAQNFSTGVQNLGGAIAKVAEVEINENAQRDGAIKAQQDFAQLQKLEDYKKQQISEYQSYMESVGDLDQLDPESETTQIIKNKIDVFKEDIGQTDFRIQSYLKKDSQFNVTERTRAEMLNEMYLDNVMIDAKGTLVELSKAFENNPVAFENQANKLLEQLGSVPEQFREAVKYNIKQDIKTFKERATENVIQQQTEQTFARRNKKIGLFINEISQLARDGAPITEKYNAVKETLKQQVIDDSITANQMNNKLTLIEKEVEQQKTLSGYDKIIKSNETVPQKVQAIKAYADEWVEKINPHLNESEKNTVYGSMISGAISLENDYQGSLENQFKVQTDRVKQITKRIISGGKVDQTDLDYAKNFLTDIDKDVAAGFQQAMMLKGQISQLRATAPTNQENYLKKLDFQIARLDEAGISTLELRAMQETLINEYRKIKADIEKDPISYLKENPLVINGQEYSTNNIKDFDNTIMTDQDGNRIFSNYTAAVTDEFVERFNKKDEINNYVGPFKMLADGEASVLNRRYGAMNKADKTKFLTSMIDAVGLTQAKGIYSEMWGKGKSTDLIAAQLTTTGFDNDTTLADDILSGREKRLSGDFKIDTDAARELREKINTKLMIAGNNIKSNNLTILNEAIQDAYLGRGGRVGEYDKDMIEDIFEELTFGTSEYNDKMVFNPAPDKDDGDLEDWIDTISIGENTFLEDHFGLPDGYENFEQFKKDLSYDPYFGDRKFQLESISRGKYLLKTKTGKYLLKDKQPYVLDWYLDDPIDPKGKRIPWDDPKFGTDNMIEKGIKNIIEGAEDQQLPPMYGFGGVRG